MRKNEPDPTKRVTMPIPFYDADGLLVAGINFNAAGECAFTYYGGGAYADTANNPTEDGGDGMYAVQLEQAETNHDSWVKVRLRKAGYQDQFLDIPIDNTPDVNVSTIAANAITAAAIADNAIDAGAFAADAITAAKIADGAIDAATFAAGAITAAAIATNAIDADALAPDGVAEIQSGLATAANLAIVAGYIDTEITALQADVTRLLGLHLQNSVLDGGSGVANVQYSAKKVLTSARRRVFASRALALAAAKGALNNADGEIARYVMTGEDDGTGKMKNFTFVQEL